MDIVELKHKIESNTFNKFPLVMKYSDNDFLCRQYSKQIAKNLNLDIVNIQSLSEITNTVDDIFDQEETRLFVYNVEKLEENVSPDSNNLIVICKSVPNDLKVDYVDISKLLNWQIEAFVQKRLPGLSVQEVSWLCENTKHDIFRLDTECNKFEIFTPAEQKNIFRKMNQENCFSDLSSLTIFDFTNALMKKDYTKIKETLQDLDSIDIEPVGLVTILRTQIKKLMSIQLNPKATADSLGMNYKQFLAIKYNIGVFSDKSLIRILDFITQVDYRLKQGDLQFNLDAVQNSKSFILYITSKVLTL